MKRKVNEPESVKMLKEAFRVFDFSGEGAVSSRFLTTGNIELDDFLKIVIDQKPQTRTCKGFNPRCCFL